MRPSAEPEVAEAGPIDAAGSSTRPSALDPEWEEAVCRQYGRPFWNI